MVRGPLLILRLEDAVSIVALDLLVLGFVDALRLMLGVRHGFIPWGIWVELPRVTSSSVEILSFLVALAVPLLCLFLALYLFRVRSQRCRLLFLVLVSDRKLES